MARVTADGGVEWDTIEKVTAESIEEAERLVNDRLRRTVPNADHTLSLKGQSGVVYQFTATHRWKIER
jgi:hypothetical protein